ncbi:MAG: response regulator transcription factor [Phycisphaerales bacterium]|nr:MAG: response regulator transcription factor [Phycisphaerales bacterium]
MRILVVEDDVDLADILRRALTEQLYHVEVAHDGESARYQALSEDLDLIVLDLMLPKVDGITVCRDLRRAGKTTPVIMLTARDKTDDRILGLDAGADDYLVKPFSMGELCARIRAVVRRAEHQTDEVLSVGSLRLDPHSSFVRRGQREIMLTAKEFALMLYLMQHPGRVLTRTEILEHVWDANYDGFGNVVDVYVNYLRNKLEEEGEPRVIETVRGRGYILKKNADDA